MPSLNIFWALIEVLYKGKELKNKETWKNAGALTGIVAAMLQVIQIAFPDLEINGVDKSQIINGITSIVLVVGSYTHIATSKTTGFNLKNKS